MDSPAPADKGTPPPGVPVALSSAGLPIDEHGREILTARNWRSLWMVLLVQSQNAFNDNVVRFVLVGLAIMVAGDAWLGRHVEEVSGVLLSLPYILLAPLAGFLCDRFSKRTVMKFCFFAQLTIFLWVLLCLWQRNLMGVIAGFLGLSIQSTFFSPAKNGILKEIVGSGRLGMAAGWMQMTLMISILLGIFLGGSWFEAANTRLGDPWRAAMEPVMLVGVLSLLPLVAVLWLMPTPAHPEVRYRPSILLSHFRDLGNVLRQRDLRLTVMGIGYYWLLAGLVGLMVIGAGREIAAGDQTSSGVDKSAFMYATIGIGLMIGSGLVAFCSRHRIELGLVPFGGAGFVIGLLWAGMGELGSLSFFLSMACIGFSGAFFLVPLNAFLQDRSAESERGRVLSATNLVTNTAGILAGVILFGMKSLGWSVSTQFLVMVLPTALVSLYVFRLLPQNALRFSIVALVRATYRIRRIDHKHVPQQGGLLVISNHVGFSDAFLLGASFDRPLRFVMIEKYYRMWWARWFLDLFGAVPITPTKAKQAIRRTAAAAAEGDMVGIFPEGQLTRTGLMHELKPGFQLIARQGDVPVLPVFMDGVWGSIFTFERNRYFRKWPRQLPYPVTVAFGRPVPARQATREWARTEFRKLSAEAFALRMELGHSLPRQWFRALSPLRSPLNPRRAHPAIITDEGTAIGPGALLRRLRSLANDERDPGALPEEAPDLDALLLRLAASLREGRVPGLEADAVVIAAQVCHMRSINLLLPGDVIRPVGDWRQPALWMLGVLSPLLGGWTLWLGRADDGDSGSRKAPRAIEGRRVLEVRVTDGGRLEVHSPLPDGVGEPWPRDCGAQWPPDRVLHGSAAPATGALVALNLPEPPLPPDAESQPSWREGSLGKLMPGVALETEQPIRLGGMPLGGRVWELREGARLDEEGFLFM